MSKKYKAHKASKASQANKASKGGQTYKELRDHWYAILAETGFEEAEDVNSPNEYMITWHSTDFRFKDPDAFLARRIYYEWATDVLNWFKFDNERDKKVWTLYADGLTYRQIAAQLDYKIKKSTVQLDVKRLEQQIREAERANNQTSPGK